jgi:hypothetical protein
MLPQCHRRIYCRWGVSLPRFHLTLGLSTTDVRYPIRRDFEYLPTRGNGSKYPPPFPLVSLTLILFQMVEEQIDT